MSELRVQSAELAGLKVVLPDVFGDDRGFFLETYRAERYRRAGIDTAFVQDNLSRSCQGTLRGLHYQRSPGQAKLVQVVSGRIWDVVVDIRPDSPTFSRWCSFELDDVTRRQLFVPVGFAHGFCVLSEYADVLYKCSSPYAASEERTIQWDDPELAITWPVDAPILSERDQRGRAFSEFSADR